MSNYREYELLFKLGEDIFNGIYVEGYCFPSYNEASKKYIHNISIVKKTYKILKQEGIIKLRPGVGFFVAPNAVDKLLVFHDKHLKNCLENLIFNNVIPFKITKEEIVNIINDTFND